MKASLSSLHHQLTDWLRETDFYKQEISVLEKRLGEVASKNTALEVTSLVEHFQNKFILTKEQLDILAHDLKKEETGVEEKVTLLPEHINEKFVQVDDKTNERMKIFASGFADLRFEFNTFLSKVI